LSEATSEGFSYGIFLKLIPAVHIQHDDRPLPLPGHVDRMGSTVKGPHALEPNSSEEPGAL
jgi:hypothetical protein